MGKRGARRVIVVGSSNTDLVVHCDLLPAGGETVLGGDLMTFAGGKGANQAVAAARAGAEVRFIGAFGDDAFGRARRADLEREGIDCSGCVVKKGVPSGVALIAIGKGAKGQKAENQIVVAPGANARLTPADVRHGMPRNLGPEDVVLCSMEVPDAAIAEAFRGRRAQNLLNPAPFPPNGITKNILQNAGTIIPNESEFTLLSGVEARTAKGEKFLLAFMDKHKVLHFVITLGQEGAVYHQRANEKKLSKSLVPAPSVRAVDTVGAGDCFCGAFAALLAEEEYAFEKAAAFAVAAASLKVTRHGAQAGMPYRGEIFRMMKL